MNTKMQLPREILSCINRIEEAGYVCYVVGGAVRDHLLNRPINDYDLTSDARPEEIVSIFHDTTVLPTGLQHGTVTIIVHDKPIEVTTFRVDHEYINHRHPEQVTFTTSLEEDCARRDFTINAMAYHPTRGFFDYFEGQKDLQDHLIRTVGDPNKRFEEDALRILRALRFSAQLDFEIEPSTKEAIFNKADGLFYISSERISAELTKLLEAENPTQILLEYRSILEVCLPELKEISLEDWSKTLTAIARSKENAQVRYALLLDSLPLSSVKSFLSRLHFSNVNANEILTILNHKSLPLETRIDFRKVLQQTQDSYEDYLAYRACLNENINEEGCLRECLSILHQGDCILLKQLAIDGHDLKEMGYEGEKIGEILEACLEAVIRDECLNEKNVLKEYIYRSF